MASSCATVHYHGWNQSHDESIPRVHFDERLAADGTRSAAPQAAVSRKRPRESDAETQDVERDDSGTRNADDDGSRDADDDGSRDADAETEGAKPFWLALESQPLRDITSDKNGEVVQCAQCANKSPDEETGVRTAVVSRAGCSVCNRSSALLPRPGAGVTDHPDNAALMVQTLCCPKCSKRVSTVGFSWKAHMEECDPQYFANQISAFSLQNADDISVDGIPPALSRGKQNSLRPSNNCTGCGSECGVDKTFHPDIPGSLLCGECHERISSNPFRIRRSETNEDRCRWCGDGGDLLLCDDCPSAFCNRCISRNMGEEGLRELTASDPTEQWSCKIAMLSRCVALSRSLT